MSMTRESLDSSLFGIVFLVLELNVVYIVSSEFLTNICNLHSM